jgi:hypothetical protein
MLRLRWADLALAATGSPRGYDLPAAGPRVSRRNGKEWTRELGSSLALTKGPSHKPRPKGFPFSFNHDTACDISIWVVTVHINILSKNLAKQKYILVKF